jgi:hypothetical protein
MYLQLAESRIMEVVENVMYWEAVTGWQSQQYEKHSSIIMKHVENGAYSD